MKIKGVRVNCVLYFFTALHSPCRINLKSNTRYKHKLQCKIIRFNNSQIKLTKLLKLITPPAKPHYVKWPITANLQLSQTRNSVLAIYKKAPPLELFCPKWTE